MLVSDSRIKMEKDGCQLVSLEEVQYPRICFVDPSSLTSIFSRQVVGYGNSTEVTSRSQEIQTGSQSLG